MTARHTGHCLGAVFASLWPQGRQKFACPQSWSLDTSTHGGFLSPKQMIHSSASLACVGFGSHSVAPDVRFPLSYTSSIGYCKKDVNVQEDLAFSFIMIHDCGTHLKYLRT